MFHAAGPSDGLQVTERIGWQKDNGEPDVSSDGRYLYYSKDVTPGQTFEYNKDPNGTIYAVMRRDLTTGRERRAVSVQGGSVAPQVSPGRQDAGLRPARPTEERAVPARSRERSRPRALRQCRQGPAGGVGDSRPVSPVRVDAGRQVDRHLGRGQDLASRRRRGKGSQIPFTAQVEQTVNDAVRFPQKVHPDEFPVRMLRDVRVSPDGKHGRLQRARQALRAALPDGQPRRLTQRTARSSSFRRSPATASGSSTRPGPTPSWDACAWSGRTAPGTRCRDRARPLRRAVVLARRPADRVQAAWRRSDARAALRRRSPASTSCRRLAASRVLVRDGGSAPGVRSHGHAHLRPRRPQREVRAAQRRRADRRIAAAGRDEIEHVRSDNATQFAPSPDGKWIAFEERFKTFVAPFPRTGRPVDVGPATQAYPVQRVSRDAGFYLHWSG